MKLWSNDGRAGAIASESHAVSHELRLLYAILFDGRLPLPHLTTVCLNRSLKGSAAIGNGCERKKVLFRLIQNTSLQV
jgi:hypothetical protein